MPTSVFGRRVASLSSHPNPLRLVGSRVLWKSGLCRHFIIKRPSFWLHFSPSALAATYWANPKAREEDERTIETLLRPGDTYIDVGANIGTLSLSASTVVGPSGLVYAIEAHPRTFGYLVENVVLNGRANIRPINLALGRANGTLFMSNLESDDQNRIAKDGHVAVRVGVLDDVTANVPAISLLKVDVEGYELPVLQGAPETLKRSEAVLFEVWEEHLQRYDCRTEDVLGFLRDAGFSIFALQDREMHQVEIGYAARECVNLLAVRDVESYCRSHGLTLRGRSR